MKQSRVAALGLALFLVSTACARADFADLGFLSGCWAPLGNEAGSGEYWTRPAGKSMLGVNRTVRKGRTVAYEYMRIVEQDDGVITLIASPSGQSTARFEMTKLSAREVVFANPAHDFPQRIIYRLDDEGNLAGRIEGKMDGAERGVDFPMQKIPCSEF